MIADVPTVWLERCIQIIDTDPATAQPAIGQPGAYRPELGPAIRDLTCASCAATWAGITGDPCWWCQKAAQTQLDHQAELLLNPPDNDPADINYDDRMKAWIQRMKVGVEAEIITKEQAQNAYQRTIKRVAA